MSKLSHSLCVSLCALSITTLSADGIGTYPQENPDPFIDANLSASTNNDPIAPITQQIAAAPKPAPKKAEAPFSPFTGKIKGRKVRLRVQPDLDSPIVKELIKNQLVSVVGKKNGFWAIESLPGIKAYVFRGFVLDNFIEGSRVNIRLEPNTDSSVIGHFNSGDRVDGVISAINNKWLEISPPSNTRFYVAQEFVEFAGGPEVKVQFDQRQASVEQLLDNSSIMMTAELKKPFDAIDFDKISKNYQLIISEYNDFPHYIEQSKESLASFQEAYLQKRISHLEAQAQEKAFATNNPKHESDQLPDSLYQISDTMKIWESLEESLYLSWTRLGENQTLQQYYDEQKLAATSIVGIIEPYTSPVRNKPGDFVVKENGLPVAYIYSTALNLNSIVGKRVTLFASPRPNNNFAFPAYFVLGVE